METWTWYMILSAGRKFMHDNFIFTVQKLSPKAGVIKKKGRKNNDFGYLKSLVQSFLNIKISKRINWNKLTKQANNVNVN